MIKNAKALNATNAEGLVNKSLFDRRDGANITTAASLPPSKKTPLRIIESRQPVSRPELKPDAFCRACGSPECVSVLNVSHSPSAQNWTLALCAEDFDNLRGWFASARLLRRQEGQE